MSYYNLPGIPEGQDILVPLRRRKSGAQQFLSVNETIRHGFLMGCTMVVGIANEHSIRVSHLAYLKDESFERIKNSYRREDLSNILLWDNGAICRFSPSFRIVNGVEKARYILLLRRYGSIGKYMVRQ